MKQRVTTILAITLASLGGIALSLGSVWGCGYCAPLLLALLVWPLQAFLLQHPALELHYNF